MSKELLNRSFSARLCLRIRPSPPNLRPNTRRKIIAQTSLKSSEYSTTTPTNPPKPSGWSSSSPSEKKTSKLKPDISIALPSTSKKSSATQVLLGDLLSSKESTPPRSTTSSTLGSLSGTLSSRMASRGGPPAFASLNRTSSFAPVSSLTPIIIPPHHLHIYSHKHNTHLTLTTPKRQPLISVSTGNIGFRKSKRGEYDAAYQLAGWVFRTIQDRGLVAEIQKLEVVFRGFGKGRDAVVKALTGVEGRSIRGRVIRVTDASRLKFGGCRSRAPRRL